ncbi:MAG: dTDP-4-dehydrorhamnose 3,5-epimerase [Hyphomicrobiales bacterium]
MRSRDIGLGILEIVPEKFGDARGVFSETWSRRKFRDLGLAQDWVQDNQSFSAEKFVLRGLHFQIEPHAQDKLVRVLRGSIFDVAVDIRRGAPSFGRCVSCTLSASAWNQILIPKGFAHGFLTLEPDTDVFYKVSAPYAPEHERAVRYDDPALAIAWPLQGATPIMSAKDRAAPLLAVAVP